MKTQSAHIGEAWSHCRDNAKGVSAEDGRELFHITKVEYLPPSKAHIKRLKRARPDVVTSHKRKPIPQVKRRAFNRERETVLDIVAILRPNFVAETRLGAAKAFAHDKPECLALNIPPDCDEPRIAYCNLREHVHYSCICVEAFSVRRRAYTQSHVQIQMRTEM